MKRTPLLLTAVTGLFVPIAGAQTSSSTPVIGYYKQTINPGNTPVVCGFTTKKDFQGAMTSDAPGSPNSVITQTGAGWTVNQFQTSAAPATDSSHFVEILSGTPAVMGLIFDIVSNTATTVTVEGNTGAVGADLAGNETYCIRKHATLGTILAGGGGLNAGSDTVSIVNPNGSIEGFVWNGANWENEATLDDGTNKVIYPGQGYIIFRGGATNATLIVGGNEVAYVKNGPTKVPLYFGSPTSPVRNMIGLINPLVSDAAAPTDTSPLGGFGLVAALQAGSDTVDVFQRNGTFGIIGTFVSNGGNLEDVATLDDGTNVPIHNGSSIRVITTGNRVTTLPQTHPAN